MSAGYTKCVNCAHQQEVMEPDRFGVKRQSVEVVHCLIFMQFKAARLIRACDQFKSRKQQEAA